MPKEHTCAESRALLSWLKKQYKLRARDDVVAARGYSKTTLSYFATQETLLMGSYISRIESGERLTEADWRRDLCALHDAITNAL